MAEHRKVPERRECRLDVWLWAVRLHRSRSEAVEACHGGRVLCGALPCKPARTVRAGDVFRVWSVTHTRTVRVLRIPERRLGPSPARACYEDLTPAEELECAAHTVAQSLLQRPRGTGRPTKRDRRDLDRLFS